jgi:predicted ATPase
VFMRPFQLGLLAEQYGRLGNAQRGLTLFAEALASVERTNERWCEAELHRRRGDLHARISAHAEAEADFRRAIDTAHYQGAQALELRSATRLADLWLEQGRNGDVNRLLGPMVKRLGSAIDLPDLAHARVILGAPADVLSPAPGLTLQ